MINRDPYISPDPEVSTPHFGSILEERFVSITQAPLISITSPKYTTTPRITHSTSQP